MKARGFRIIIAIWAVVWLALFMSLAARLPAKAARFPIGDTVRRDYACRAANVGAFTLSVYYHKGDNIPFSFRTAAAGGYPRYHSVESYQRDDDSLNNSYQLDGHIDFDFPRYVSGDFYLEGTSGLHSIRAFCHPKEN